MSSFVYNLARIGEIRSRLVNMSLSALYHHKIPMIQINSHLIKPIVCCRFSLSSSPSSSSRPPARGPNDTQTNDPKQRQQRRNRQLTQQEQEKKTQQSNLIKTTNNPSQTTNLKVETLHTLTTGYGSTKSTDQSQNYNQQKPSTLSSNESRSVSERSADDRQKLSSLNSYDSNNDSNKTDLKSNKLSNRESIRSGDNQFNNRQSKRQTLHSGPKDTILAATQSAKSAIDNVTATGVGTHKVQEIASDIKQTATHMFDSVFNAGNKVVDSMSRAAQKTMSGEQSAINRIIDESKTRDEKSIRIVGKNDKKSVNINTLNARHEPNLNRFSIQLDGRKDPAVLQYRKLSNHKIEFYHTEVPEAYRNQGIASVLAKAAFDHAVNNHIKTKVTCTYLRDYLKKCGQEKYKRISDD